MATRLQEGELEFDGWQEEWWFHEGYFTGNVSNARNASNVSY